LRAKPERRQKRSTTSRHGSAKDFPALEQAPDAAAIKEWLQELKSSDAFSASADQCGARQS